MPDIDARVLEECAKAVCDLLKHGRPYDRLSLAGRHYYKEIARAVLTTAQQQGEKEPMSDCNHDDMPEQPGTGDYAEDHFWFRAKAIRIGLERALNNGVGFELEKHIAFEFQRIHNESATHLAAAEKVVEAARKLSLNAVVHINGVWDVLARDMSALGKALAAYPPTPQTEVKG